MIRRAARMHGVADPFMLLARLRRFAEPSEVDAPLELIRASIVFQARGIVNTRAIQHNLDWVWPYWVERQFDPRDSAFIPRSFSLAHINLTHRNWTAVCVPDSDTYALVDPRGLVTPLHDGWSLDAWVISDGKRLVPSRREDVSQVMNCRRELAIATRVASDGLSLISHVEMSRTGDRELLLEVAFKATGPPGGMLCVSLRPYNPEGIQFIDSVSLLDDGPGWLVNRTERVLFSRGASRYVFSTYEAGDVFDRLNEEGTGSSAICPVGMATAAALFPLVKDGSTEVKVTVPIDLPEHSFPLTKTRHRPHTSWSAMDSMTPELDIPDKRITDIYLAATRTLQSLSAGEIIPGSFTYRRFWFRDACLMLNALLTLNHSECCQRALEDSFPRRQTVNGFFESQQGEWDSNGQVLWLADRYRRITRRPLPDSTLRMLRKGAVWLCWKRQTNRHDHPHPGLLPAGFSAEHLGTNNYYYWDNFWGIAGLRGAASLFQSTGDQCYARHLTNEAEAYLRCVQANIEGIPVVKCNGAIPAAPGRRMDSGAIGSIVADYPLQLVDRGNPGIMKTVEFLLSHCMIDNGFFHDMIHSGINPYLTLQLAQVLLRNGDSRYIPLFRRIADLASPTGQWPEAIHPTTLGGCMGDGQHGWAAAEWVLMVRSLFVREEKERLVIGSGLLPEWLTSGRVLRFGPTATPFGSVTVRVDTTPTPPVVTVEGVWHGEPPPVEALLPGQKNEELTVITARHGVENR